MSIGVFTEMVTSTHRNWQRGVVDNLTDHNGLLFKLKQKGHIKTITGGEEMAIRLRYAENGTYQRYHGYDQLNTSASNTLSAAKYEFRQVALHVTASGEEVRKNSGENAMINLVKERIQAAQDTAANNFSIDLFSDGTLSNQIGGLAHIVQTAGTGTVGGINSSTYTFWQNKVKEMTGTNTAASPSAANSTQMRGDMNALWLQLNRGMDKPDLIVFSHDFYSLYELGLQENQRYASAQMAEAGFQSVMYKGADVIFDDNSNFSTTAEKGYFLNCKYLEVRQHRDAQWSQDDPKRVVNQDAVVIPIYWMGNMTCSNRSLQGILIDAS